MSPFGDTQAGDPHRRPTRPPPREAGRSCRLHHNIPHRAQYSYHNQSKGLPRPWM